ncbi:hypothetical protein SMSP2_01758 [Limihaloglobus sulfuriphilus]|uniref:Type II secretion system protein J n=1 Tax=Limihaloglobus sulfuriphilus TaxID=1851148 RepID=A0A1Q2MF99_9BACT|nr:prepilin-type N-terminal cleavage/methylation domain-containing protein [Limihaloglobus sulfuriphilus]AQQ71385.1 hypothetical protein SMSP2_01758 [Limihaloglobus sulfuriphilus]
MSGKINTTRNTGFTLLELMVALAIMGVIALSMYSSIFIASRAKDTTDAALGPYNTIMPAFDMMRNDIIAAMSPGGLFAGYFTGTEESAGDDLYSSYVSFYTAGFRPSAGEKASNIIRVEYFLGDAFEYDDKYSLYDIQEESEQLVLIRRKTLNLLSTDSGLYEDEIVCRGLASFALEYYDGYSWVSSWDPEASDIPLPMAVRVSFVLNEDCLKTQQGRAAKEDMPVYTKTFVINTIAAEQEVRE